MATMRACMFVITFFVLQCSRDASCSQIFWINLVSKPINKNHAHLVSPSLSFSQNNNNNHNRNNSHSNSHNNKKIMNDKSFMNVLQWMSTNYQLDTNYSDLSWKDVSVDIPQDLEIKHNEGHRSVQGKLVGSHSVVKKDGASVVRVVLGDCEANAVLEKSSPSSGHVVPAPDHCVVECNKVGLVLKPSLREKKSMWETLVMILSLRFLGNVPEIKADLLKMLDDKYDALGTVRSIVAHPDKVTFGSFQWGELEAGQGVAAWTDATQQLLLQNVSSLPSWLASWNLVENLPHLTISVQQSELCLVLPTMVLQSTRHTNGKDFVPSMFIQALVPWGFGSVKSEMEGIHIVLKGLGCELKIEDIQLSLERESSSAQQQWTVHLTIGSILIGGCVRLYNIVVSGTYEADGSAMHNLSVSADQMLLLATGDNRKLLLQILKALGSISRKVKIPLAKVGEIPCVVRMDAAETETKEEENQREKKKEEEENKKKKKTENEKEKEGEEKQVTEKNEMLLPWEADEKAIVSDLWHHYSKVVKVLIKGEESEIKETLTDKLTATAGLVATGVSIATPAGAVISMAALRARDGLKHVVSVGKQSRGEAANGRYRVGDVARGIKQKLRKKGSSSSADGSNEGVMKGEDPKEHKHSEMEYLKKNKHRYVSAGAQTVGAAVGLTLLGPVGLVLGAITAGVAAKKLTKGRKKKNKLADDATSFHEDDELYLESALSTRSASTVTDDDDDASQAESIQKEQQDKK